MQATSRRQRHADFAKRTCCRNPAVLGEHPKHSSSFAANNQRNTSTTILQQFSKVITGFGSKKPLSSDPPASIVHETAKTSRCKPTVNHNALVEVNASVYDLEDEKILPAATQQQERDQGKAGQQAQEEVKVANAEGAKLRRAMQKHVGERYAHKQLHSRGSSQRAVDSKITKEVAEAKVLRAEEDASRLAASFMMKAAVTKALHEEQASIVQADATALVRAAEQRLQTQDIKYADILRDTANYLDAAEEWHSQALSEASKQQARQLQAQSDSALSHLQQEQREARLQLKVQHEKFEGALAQLKAQHDSEVIRLMKESSDACTEAQAAMQADIQARLAQQHLDHDKAKKALHTQLAQQFEQQQSSLTSQHEAEKQSLMAKHASCWAEYQAQRDSEVQSLQARHESAILQVQAEHSFEMQNFKSQHNFAFESSEAQHESQLQATLAEHAAATVRTQRQHQSELEALRSHLEAQAQHALADSQKQHDAAMSAYQAHLHSNRAAHIAELVAQHSAESERSLSQQQAAHSDLVAQLQERHVAEASQSRKRHADAQAQHDFDIQALKAEHEATTEKIHAKAESAVSAHRAQLSTLQESHAQHESQVQVVQAEHEANMQALETKHSGAIAQAQTQLDTLTAQTAAAADKVLTQHEADVHALIAQREATDRAVKDKCEAEAELKIVRRLLEESEAGLAKSQKTHAATLLTRLSEVRAQHRNELANQAAQSYGKDTEGALAHLRAKHEDLMRTELELRDNKIHDARLKQRTATHKAQNLRSQLTQAQSHMDHHILKRTQEGAVVRQQVVKLQQQLADLQSSFDEEHWKAIKLEGQLMSASKTRKFLDGQVAHLRRSLKSVEQSKEDAQDHVERLTVELEANRPGGHLLAGSSTIDSIPVNERGPTAKSQPHLQRLQAGLQVPHVQAQPQTQQQQRSGLERQSVEAEVDREARQATGGPEANDSRLVEWEAKWAPGHPVAGSSERRPAEERHAPLQAPQAGLQVPHMQAQLQAEGMQRNITIGSGVPSSKHPSAVPADAPVYETRPADESQPYLLRLQAGLQTPHVQAQLQAKAKQRNDIKASGVSRSMSVVPPAASSDPSHKGKHAPGSKASTEVAAPSSHAPSPGPQSSTNLPNGAPAAGPRHIPAAGLAGVRATADDTLTTAAASRRHSTAASDGAEARGSASMTTTAARPKHNSAAAIAEPRQHAQAELDPMSEIGQHASRPVDRLQASTGQPGQNIQAENNNRLQDCQHSDSPCASPLRETFKPTKYTSAKGASTSTVHPGGETGVDLNEPSAQACPDGQVHSLEDTLSNALQELLLTEDREDFAQSIQALLSNNDVAHLLKSLLSASWHKLRGASWHPVISSDVRRLYLASIEQRVAVARAGLDRHRRALSIL